MTTTAVDIVVRVAGTNKLDAVQSKFKGTAAEAVKAATQIDRVGDEVKIAGDKAARSVGGFNKLNGAINVLGRSLAGLAIGDQLRRAFGASAELSGTEQRIQNVTQEYQQFIGIQESAAQAATTFSVSNQQALSDFSDLASRLGSTGASLKDLENIYGGFNTLLVNNAVGAQQAAAAQLQLNQALGSGRLNGEEYNTIIETTPQLLDEIAKITGVARGELKQFAADGGITSKIIIQALTNIRTQGADKLAAALDTPAGKLREFNKAIAEFQVAVGNELLPVITPLIVETTKLLKAFGELPGPVKQALVGLTALAAAAVVLGPVFGVIAGGAKALGAGLLALGGGAGAAASALSLTTKALLVLKGALIALPWVAAAAGLTALTVATVKYYQEKAQLNKLLDASNTMTTELSGAQSQLKSKINETSAALVNASNKLEQMRESGISNARAIQAQSKRVRELQALLDNLEGEYQVVVRIIEIREKFGIDPTEGGAGTRGRQGGINKRRAEKAAEKIRNAVSTPIGSTVGGGGGGRSGAAAPDPFAGVNEEFERFVRLQREQLEASEQALGNSKFQLDFLKARNREEEINVQFAKSVSDVLYESQKLYDNAISTQEKDNILKARSLQLETLAVQKQKDLNALREGGLINITDEIEGLEAQLNGMEDIYQRAKDIKAIVNQGGGTITEGEAAGLVDRRNELQEQVEAADALKQQYESIASGIASEFTSAFKSIIDGTKDVNEAFADMLQGIADQFLNMAMKILQDALTQQLVKLFAGLLGGGISGGIGASAAGGIGGGAFNIGLGSFDGGGYTGDGPRSGGIDGKGGFPALLHPQETVVDHYQEAQSAMVEPSKAFADSSEAMEMAMATRSSNTASAAEASAMQTAESYFASGKSTVRFDTYRVGEMDVVTREDAIRIGQQSAKQAEANVYKGLRNMPSVRSRSGVK